jgi:LacI family transcriptional regulator, galactose operon repressor
MNKNAEQPMTLSRLAVLADTSASTVSRVLSNDPRISVSTRNRVLEVLKKHPYRPNTFARALKGGQTGVIGVISSSISSGFYAEVLRGIDGISRSRSTHLMCSFAHGVEDYQQMAFEWMTGGRVDGIILIDPPMELFDAPLLPRTVPVVLCASRAVRPESVWHDTDSVTVDSRVVMAQLVSQLAEQGCRNWIHLAGPRNSFDAESRRTAFEEVLAQQNNVNATVLDGHLIEEDGIRTAKQLLRNPEDLPDAWICFNDSTARGVIRTLEAATDWKGRMGLTGWDDADTAALLGLTSVAMPMTELGQQAAEMLLDRLASAEKSGAPPRHLSLPAAVHFRTSTIMTPIPSLRSPTHGA